MGWLNDMISADLEAQRVLQQIMLFAEKEARMKERRAKARNRGYRPSRLA